ncbi:hypothetical protein BDN72DRAFT_843751 [Pluteus cervinus]|uniref:Uncharacterized protein n=1 Tax=Pluteus cervinus TaxID=181527 RepID=A0ACD3AM79_9AGAR|nr:hypothetical protein BDN72DRAFT_843751 [Pluteus cervinus]
MTSSVHSIFQIASPNLSSSSPRFPVEILELILHPFQPTSDISVGSPLQDIKRYTTDLHGCSQLRLVNREWCGIITPILYSFLLIPAQPLSLQRKRCLATDHHPELVKTVFLHGIFDAYTQTEHKHEILLILRSALEKCTQLKRIEVDFRKHPAWVVEKKATKELFEGLTKTKLREVVVRQPGVEFFGGLVEGLAKGTLATTAGGNGFGTNGCLKALTLDGINVDTIDRPFATDAIPVLEQLEKLHITLLPFSGRRESFLDFITSILDPRSRHPDVPALASVVPTQCRLRELTISARQHWIISTPSLYRFLTISQLNTSLTSLRLRIHPPSDPESVSALGSSYLDVFDTLPTSILELCPRVTRFHFLTWCPVSLLLGNLPERIVELGVRIADDPNVKPPSIRNPNPIQAPNAGRPPYPLSALHSLGPVMEFVNEPGYRKGVKRLYVEWPLGKKDEEAEAKLRDVCERVGVEFCDSVDF